MWEKLRLIKFVLWFFLIGSGLLLISVFGFKAIFAEQSIDDELATTVESSSPGVPVQVIQPEIAVEVVNGRLRANLAGAEASDWQYIGPNTISACASTLFNSLEYEIRYGNEVLLTPGDYGRYYCFRALSHETNQYSYYAYRVHYLNVAIFVSQDYNASGQIILEADSHFAIDDWQNIILDAADVCVSAIFEESTSEISSGNQVILRDLSFSEISQPLDYAYCFRGRVQGNWIYQKRTVKLDSLNFRQQPTPGRITILAGDLPVSIKGQYVLSESANCSLDDFSGAEQILAGNKIPVLTQNIGKQHCFRIKDTEHTYHYTAILY